jgi:hypothetical protein
MHVEILAKDVEIGGAGARFPEKGIFAQKCGSVTTDTAVAPCSA